MNPPNASKITFFHKAPSRITGFSLVELLVVVAVIAVMVSLTLIAVGSVGGARKLVNAGNHLVTQLNTARQAAQTKNTLAMLVVAKSEDKTPVSLHEYDRTSGGWTQIGRWTPLPDSIRFEPSDRTLLEAGNYPQAPNLSYRGKNLPPGTGYDFVVFLPDGRPLFNKSSITPPLSVRLRGNNTDDYYRVIVNENTGIPLVSRP